MEKEIWKDIVGYENKYQISSLGKVRRIKKDGRYREVKSSIWGRYYTVDLYNSKNEQPHNRQYIHRLVALHFIPNPRGVNYVNHLNGDIKNNTIENLEWCTNSENLIHASRVLDRHIFGHKPKPVNKFDLDGIFIKRFNSIGEACQSVDVKNARSHISECCAGKITSAYGFIWQYADGGK